MNKLNREAWLTEVAKGIEPMFKGMRGAIKPYRVTCGWPSRQAISINKRIGECHGVKSSKDGVHEIFISPLIDEPVEVAGVVAHEIVHVVAGLQAAHGKGFVEIANYIGLTKGKPTSASPGKLLSDELRKMTEKLGPYPHKAIILQPKPKKIATVQSLSCKECGCRLTISFKWLEESGIPICGCGGEMVSGE